MERPSGYHQIWIADEDVPKTAFLAHKGFYQYKALCFGLSNAPSTFQNVMHIIIAPVLGKFAQAYIDDILIFSLEPSEHPGHMDQVLELLRKNKFFCKFSKCEFGKQTLTYLGHIVGQDEVRPDPRKLQTLGSWPVPKTPQQVRSF